jgi:DNA polymerase III subunit delta'
VSAARRPQEDDDAEAPHPRETTAWFGHAAAEHVLLDAYRGGRIPHAWLIGGPPGIGKATLAYRMARFVLAHPDPSAAAVQGATTLALASDHPAARRIAARAHGGLLVLERSEGESGALRTVITVDEVRRTIGFFGRTAGEGGWRICIVDSADELQYPQGSNALLKILEEPPARALFLLVSHAPGRLLPTIRSRCRHLALRALAVDDVARAAAAALGRDADDGEVAEAAAAADGSVGRAVQLLGGDALKVRERVSALLAALPSLDAMALHALGDALGRSDPQAFAAFVDTVRDWLSARLARGTAEPARLAQVAQVWEKLNGAAREVEVFNLDRKPMVFAVFGLLAEAAR